MTPPKPQKKRKPRTWIRWLVVNLNKPLGGAEQDDGICYCTKKEAHWYPGEELIRVRITELPARKSK